jgi:hypothetical protein
MPTKGHDARRLRAADRRALVLDLRRSGESFRTIAERLRTPLSTVHKDYDRALSAARALESTEAEQQRALDLLRLDRWLSRLAPFCEAGSPAHVGMALRVLERRARLLGLDAPSNQRLEVAGRDGGPIEFTILLDRSESGADLPPPVAVPEAV